MKRGRGGKQQGLLGRLERYLLPGGSFDHLFSATWCRLQNAPHILNMIQRFNRISAWTATEIVKTDDVRSGRVR